MRRAGLWWCVRGVNRRANAGRRSSTSPPTQQHNNNHQPPTTTTTTQVGVPCILDSPGVGKNMVDHINPVRGYLPTSPSNLFLPHPSNPL